MSLNIITCILREAEGVWTQIHRRKKKDGRRKGDTKMETKIGVICPADKESAATRAKEPRDRLSPRASRRSMALLTP